MLAAAVSMQTRDKLDPGVGTRYAQQIPTHLLKVMLKLVVAIMTPYRSISTSIDKPTETPRAARAAYMYSWYFVLVTTPYMSTSSDWTCKSQSTDVSALY
jgi:hypothetical protein